MILLADGFETVEALMTLDLFKRSHKITVDTVSISSSLEVVSSANVKVIADKKLSEIDANLYDFMVLPGGKLGVENLGKSHEVRALIQDYLERGKDVHAICAAPSILGEMGYLDDLKYTCFPGFQRGKGEYVHTGYVETPHIITGHSMGFTMDFAKAIIAHYFGSCAVEAILPGVEGR